jgi:hypothetical protein
VWSVRRVEGRLPTSGAMMLRQIWGTRGGSEICRAARRLRLSRCKAGYGRHFVGLQGCEVKKWKPFRQKAGLQAEKKAAKFRLDVSQNYAEWR